jgi:hypothetical protein
MRSLAIVVFVMGCSDGPSSDLDGDGIADDEDACQAGFPDKKVDIDQDFKDASVDLCPHDANAAAGDLDEDGIPDSCDPFVGAATPDTRRCITSFSVRWMNASYLEARVGEQAWDLAPPLSATASENVSIVSTLPLDYRTTSFDVLGHATFATADETSSFKLWLRAVDTPSDKDVGCGVDGAGNVFVFASNTRQAIRPLPAPITGPFRMRASVVAAAPNTPTRATVLCRVTVGDQSIATTLEPAIQPGGRFGFASAQADITIDSLVIDTNDATVPFRNHYD